MKWFTFQFEGNAITINVSQIMSVERINQFANPVPCARITMMNGHRYFVTNWSSHPDFDRLAQLILEGTL